MNNCLKITVALALILSLPAQLRAAPDDDLEISPKSGWEDFSEDDPRSTSRYTNFWESVLFYLPNRALDFLDIVGVDLGIGPSAGGILRIGDSFQLGGRYLKYKSLRLGMFGRAHAPFMLESQTEYGLSPWPDHFQKSGDRELCDYQMGVGVDLGLGINVDLCPGELLDFVGGFFLLDPSRDDS